jgi:CHAD domain-containing protein
MLAAPAASVAALVLEAHHRKAARLGRRLKRLDTPALHRLRIRIKKLRYAAEFLVPYAPGRGTKRYLAALRDLQQALGAWHDLAIAEARLAALHPAGAAPLADWLAAREAAQREAARQAWRRFTRRKRFWDRPKDEQP